MAVTATGKRVGGSVLVGLLVLSLTTGAEASQVSNGLGKAWGYVTTPINCVAVLMSDLVSAGTKFVVCVLGNLNPSRLIP